MKTATAAQPAPNELMQSMTAVRLVRLQVEALCTAITSRDAASLRGIVDVARTTPRFEGEGRGILLNMVDRVGEAYHHAEKAENCLPKGPEQAVGARVRGDLEIATLALTASYAADEGCHVGVLSSLYVVLDALTRCITALEVPHD